MVNDDGSAKYADYADYIVNHQRKPGIGPLAGFRGLTGDDDGQVTHNPNQLGAYIANGSFWHKDISLGKILQNGQYGVPEIAVDMGFYDSPQPYDFKFIQKS